MPIIEIISQPSASELKAAYRPVVLIVRASRTDDNPRPPVVYCDIYVAGVFYKSQLKTQHLALNDTDSDWQFDIQDACQEVLEKKLAANTTSEITEVAEIMKSVYCKFRSSGINSEGFITPEDTAPMQGTGMNAPVAGTGTQSNVFWVANSTLQHLNNQDLATHLNVHKKNGTWAETTYPLSHRPNGYKVGLNDTDVFPIIHLGEKGLKCVVLNYKIKGQTRFHSMRYCFPFPCNINLDDVIIEVLQQAPDVTYVIYRATWTVTGDPLTTYTQEYSLDDGATWLPITIIDSTDNTQLSYSLGADTINEVLEDHMIRITPIGGSGVLACASAVGTFTTVECVGVGITGSPVLPNAVTGEAYAFSFTLTGTAPFGLTDIVKPAWMAISITGSTVNFSGTPEDPADDEEVTFNINNCSDSTAPFAGTITNVPRPSLIETSNTDTGVDGTRTQIAQVGSSVVPGNIFNVEVYSHTVSYTAISGDTPGDVAIGLRDAVNATSEASWDSASSAPPSGTLGFPPTATASGDSITIVLNYVNAFAFSAQIS